MKRKQLYKLAHFLKHGACLHFHSINFKVTFRKPGVNNILKPIHNKTTITLVYMVCIIQITLPVKNLLED